MRVEGEPAQVLTGIEQISKERAGLFRFCSRAGSGRQNLWVGLIDAQDDQWIQLLFTVIYRIGPFRLRAPKSNLEVALASQGPDTWYVVDRGHSLTAFPSLPTNKLDALLPLRLVTPTVDGSTMADALRVLAGGGTHEVHRPDLGFQGPIQLVSESRGHTLLITTWASGKKERLLGRQRLLITPADAGEEALLPSQWPQVVSPGEVQDWRPAGPSAAPESWPEAREQLHNVFVLAPTDGL